MSKLNENHHPAGMSRRLTLLFAIAGGAAVGNLYWAQPLLNYIANAFNVSSGMAGLLVTLTQIGYALGVLLIVPLGDIINRRRLIPAIMAFSTIALAACAMTPSFNILLVALSFVGISTVTGQLLIPLAGDLTSDKERGKTVGTIVSGVLTGILVSRTISGLLADMFGWRAIYAIAAVISAILTIIMIRALPADRPRSSLPYSRLLISVFTVVGQHSAVRVTLILGSVTFSIFTMFWTGLTFLLSSQPYSYSATQIGLVGLVGLAGSLAAQRAGGLHDRGWSVQAIGISLFSILISLIIAGLGANSIIAILAAVILLDIAVQTVNVLNQIRLFSVDTKSRSRLNTAFVTCNFIGGALGSSLAGFMWQQGGWQAIILCETALVLFALLVWVLHRNRSQATK